MRRAELADGAWVDHAPGWVTGHDLLFDQLERSLAWRTESRRMYDRTVATPRLLAGVPAGAAAGLLDDLRRALAARYGEDFVRVTAALYRDGSDSVAYRSTSPGGRSTSQDGLRVDRVRPLAMPFNPASTAARGETTPPASGRRSRSDSRRSAVTSRGRARSR